MWNQLFYKTEKSHAEKKKMEYNKIFRVVVIGTVINKEKEDRQELGPGYQREGNGNSGLEWHYEWIYSKKLLLRNIV